MLSADERYASRLSTADVRETCSCSLGIINFDGNAKKLLCLRLCRTDNSLWTFKECAVYAKDLSYIKFNMKRYTIFTVIILLNNNTLN